MKGSKPVLGGGITAVIAAIAVGITVYGNRAPQTVPVAKASDPGGRPLAAVGITPRRGVIALVITIVMIPPGEDPACFVCISYILMFVIVCAMSIVRFIMCFVVCVCCRVHGCCRIR